MNLLPLSKTKRAAKESGSKYYFTGKPQKCGHLCERLTSNSGCVLCRKEEHIKNRDKYIARKRKYREKNLEKCRQSVRDWYKKYPERAKEKAKKSQKKNWDKRLAYHKKWREKNRDKVLSWNRNYTEKNKESVRNMILDWAKKNPEKKRAIANNRRSRKNNANGHHTAKDLKRIMKEQNGLCAACGIKLDDKYHLDHIVPLFLEGSNWPTNLQYLCVKCNTSKGSKNPIEWAAKHGMKMRRIPIWCGTSADIHGE